MRSIDKVFALCRASNRPLPEELPGSISVMVSGSDCRSEALDPGRQRLQRGQERLHGQAGGVALPGQVLLECVPPPFGGGTHS